MTDGFWCWSPRDVLEVTGADAVSYLQSQLSQDITTLEVGGSAWSLVLEPTGKVGALVRVTRTGDGEMVVDVDEGYGEEVRSRLDRFRIRVKAEVVPVPWRCIAVRGISAAPGPTDGTWMVPGWWDADAGAIDLLGPDPAAPDGVEVGDAALLEAARIEVGWPAMGREITEQTIPAELGPLLDLAVSFTKGCYPGQELVERMDSRGASAPRQLRRLRSDDEPLQAGASVVVDGREVGRVTSAAGGLALALVGRAVEPGAEVQVDGVAAAVLALR
jgi:folate-binding protein YgfZ